MPALRDASVWLRHWHEWRESSGHLRPASRESQIPRPRFDFRMPQGNDTHETVVSWLQTARARSRSIKTETGSFRSPKKAIVGAKIDGPQRFG
jgi:hypothetical protein